MEIQLYIDNKPFIHKVENLSFSNGEPGGFLTCNFDIRVSDVKQPLEELGFDLLSDVIIREGFDVLWQGFISDISRETGKKKISINCLGYWAHGKDNTTRRIYCDTSFTSWENKLHSDTIWEPWSSDMYSTDTNSRLFIGCRKGESYPLNYSNQFVYTALPGETISRIKFSFAVNYDNAYFRARLYTRAGTTWTLSWEQNVSGASSGSQDIALPTNIVELILRLHCVTAYSYTLNDGAWYAKFTNIKVYQTSIHPIYASSVIKEVISNFCPKLSTDFSEITTTTFVIEPLIFEDETESMSIFEEINKYHAFKMGVWENKKFYFLPWHSDIDYYADTNLCKLSLSGESVEDLYNRVKVKYSDETGKTRYVLREDTSTENYLNQKGWNRTAVISAETTDTDKAIQVGDIFLSEHKILENVGPLEALGTAIKDRNGLPIPFYRLRAGKNIRIRDMRGRLTDFKVVKVDVNYSSKTSNLSLDRIRKTLEVLLARMRLREAARA